MMGSSLLRLVMTTEGGSFIDAGAQISSDTMMLALVSSTMLTIHATCYNIKKNLRLYELVSRCSQNTERLFPIHSINRLFIWMWSTKWIVIYLLNWSIQKSLKQVTTITYPNYKHRDVAGHKVFSHTDRPLKPIFSPPTTKYLTAGPRRRFKLQFYVEWFFFVICTIHPKIRIVHSPKYVPV